MASTGFEKDRIRVTIFPREQANWAAKDAPQSLVKHWIELGREREKVSQLIEERTFQIDSAISKKLETLDQKIDSIQQKLDSLIHFVVQMGNLSAIASAVDQYQIELLKYKEKQGDLTFTERNQLNLCKRKEKNF